MSSQCFVCGKAETSNNRLLKCGRCTVRLYCGQECQKQDRLTHKWANTHLYEFENFDHPDVRGSENRLSWKSPLFKLTDLSTIDEGYDNTRDSSRYSLRKVLDDPKHGTIFYNYDFGDDWEHVISCTGRTAATDHFICIDGEGHSCAEDVGGSGGWMELRKAYDSTNPTEEQKEKMSWFETFASNKDPEGLRGELKWKWDKERINVVLGELGYAPSGPPNSLPSVLLVSPDKASFFDEMYSDVLARLRSHAAITQVTHISSAMQHMEKALQGSYTAVIITDQSLMEPEFIAVHEQIFQYAHGGGTVILGFHCSSFARPDTANKYFKDQWKLKRKYSNYRRDDFKLNLRANPAFMDRRRPSLPIQYSMKGVYISNTKPEERIYVSATDSDQSPAIFANCGNGHLGWIGDVNTEQGTTELLLSMCGL